MEDDRLAGLPGWTINAAGHLEKTFAHPAFRPGLEFVQRVGEMSEETNHHGDLHLTWGGTRLEVWTHTAGGLTEKDFAWARRAEALWNHEGSS